MRTIIARSVGSVWRSDVCHAAQYDSVTVTDLDGRTLGRIHTSKDAIGRTSVYLNGQRTTYPHVFTAFNRWADVIGRQQTARYRATL